MTSGNGYVGQAKSKHDLDYSHNLIYILTLKTLCIYQFSGLRLQILLENPMFPLFPIEKPMKQTYDLAI